MALEARVHKAPWITLVQGNNLRRTGLVLAAYTFQQITGAAFVSYYQTTFYNQNGYAAEAFTYPVISASLTVLATFPGMWLVDSMGRRPLLIASQLAQAFFMYLLAGLGGMDNKSQAINNSVVASFMLYAISYNVSEASCIALIG